MRPGRTSGFDQTPTACNKAATPYRVRPTHTTTHPFSRMSPQASVQLLASLELVAMEGEEPPSPRNLSFSTSSQGARLDNSASASPSMASTVSCSTEGYP